MGNLFKYFNTLLFMKKRGIYVLVVVLVLAIISFVFDSEIVKAVSSVQTDFLTDFFMGLTFVSSVIIIFFVLTALFLWTKNKRRWILPLWFTLVLSVVVSFILKFTIQRQRPFQLGIVSILDVLEKANFSTWNFSFPSFQSMFVFCSIPILAKEFPKLRYFWIIFATLVAFSRVYFGLHFLSDVLVGGLVGYLLGVLVVKLEEKYRISKKVF